MLVELSIQNIALIEHLQLQFGPGFVALTGETGAGKSIILDALGLLLGSRGSSDVIRHGADRALVDGVFRIDKGRAEVHRILSEWGIELDEGQVVVSRELHTSGRTVCRVNGRIVTVQMLRDLGNHLVQRQGQHDYQGLLRSEDQMRMLDRFAGHDPLVARVESLYHAWQEARQTVSELTLDEQTRSRELDMLEFQIREIEQAQLTPDEEEPLLEERRKLQHLDRILQHLEAATRALDGAGPANGAVAALADAHREVSSAAAYVAELDEHLQLLETAQVHAEEAAQSLARYIHRLDVSPGRLEEIETRYALIRSLERKYGATVNDVLQFLAEARARREELLNVDTRKAAAEQRLQALAAELQGACEALHTSRAQAAVDLAARIEAVLRQLDIPNASFAIRVERRSETAGGYGPHGFDSVQYLFSANRGEAQKPLNRIASGGELSRTLLALKSVLSEVDEVDTLVFDEIDTGVSGSAAVRIAEQLSALARNQQVLCVTHAAAIAARATEQWEVQKTDTADATTTTARRLDREERVLAVARLLGSEGADDTAVEHARALLHTSRPER
ncbi:MAG: DNA repair protein RecN [Alicyclobacillus sp.]|nr:DNA repair protein RecN [Alicyclobacillus sp.]